MKLGIISDTHNDLSFVDKAIERFKKDKISTLIHCGDICNAETLSKFKVFKNVFITKGNSDEENIKEIKNCCKKNKFYFWDEYADLTLQGKNVAITHSNNFKKFTDLIESEKYDYVFYGNSHKDMIGKEKNTFVVNSGSFDTNTVCIVDLENDDIKITELE